MLDMKKESLLPKVIYMIFALGSIGTAIIAICNIIKIHLLWKTQHNT